MGLNTMGSGAGNATYFGLYGGEIVIEFDDREKLEKKIEKLGLDPEDILERKRVKGKNEGKPVYYYVFNDIEGLLTNVYLKETDFGEFLSIVLTDADEKYVISLGDVFSRHSKDFIRRMEAIDLNKDLAVGTWAMEADNGKNYSGVRLYQGGEKIEYVLATEDLPAPIERKKGKKKEWDYTEQEEFLYEKIESFIQENFKGAEEEDDEEEEGEPKSGTAKNNSKGKKISGKVAPNKGAEKPNVKKESPKDQEEEEEDDEEEEGSEDPGLPWDKK